MMSSDTLERRYFITLQLENQFLCNGFLATAKSAIVPADVSVNVVRGNLGRRNLEGETSERRVSQIGIWTTRIENILPDFFIVTDILEVPTQDPRAIENENLAVVFVSISEQNCKT